MNTNIIKWVISLLVVFGLAFFIYAAVKINQPATTTSRPQDFEIKKGQTSGEIAAALKEQKLTRSDILFRVYLRFKQAENKLQAGSYALDSNMSIPEIVEILTQGKVKSSGVRVTIIEGWTISDIGEELEKKGLVEKEEFIKTAVAQKLEGYLFPDTYLFRQDAGVEVIIAKIQANFKLKVGEIDEKTLILASMVEKEVGRNVKAGTVLSSEEKDRLLDERRIVADIFWKRLEMGIALESDATLAYVTGSKSSRVTFQELAIDSPYNTYKYRGLPPTPIANPSLDAILAVRNPARTNYLFFLTSPDGTAYFARTLAEHARNREKYLE